MKTLYEISEVLKCALDIPTWILTKDTWQAACLRGLFDTDGCTYIDHHRYKEKVYGNLGLAFASNSDHLLKSISSMLKSLGYSPTRSTGRRILLRKESDIISFFKEIKPNCNRHRLKFLKFMEEYRSGYNGIASKAIVAVK